MYSVLQYVFALAIVITLKPYLLFGYNGFAMHLQNTSKQEAPGSLYSCAEGYKLYKIGTQGVHVRQAI